MPQHIVIRGARYLWRQAKRARLRAVIERTRPIRVPASGDVVLHLLCGRRTVLEAVIAAKSYLRFDAGAGLLIHDDGTLSRAHARFLERHVRGLQIVERARADREVEADLVRCGLARCLELRRSLIFAIKFFDLHFYGRGHRAIYFDTDVLFLREPVALLEALHAGAWRDRYAEDVRENYAWPRADIESHTGVTLLPSVNAGLLCLQRDEPHWPAAEHCLELGMAGARRWYVEQTLAALDMSVAGGLALPADYDVCFREAWRADWDASFARGDATGNVTAEHYCGGERHRSFYYRDFREVVLPALR